MISSKGIKPNRYSHIIQRSLVLEDLWQRKWSASICLPLVVKQFTGNFHELIQTTVLEWYRR